MERIAELMDAVCRDVLVFEFVGIEDANMPHLSGRRDIYYDLEGVKAALRAYFPNIEEQGSDRATRRRLICRR
jgi:hypothetical protein